MSSRAKNKGSSFERKISKILSERFKDDTGIDQGFRRNIDSGSYFGGRNQFRKDVFDTSKATFGDIICPPGFLFNLECKFYKTAPSFSSIVKQDLKQWDGWLSQAKQDAENASSNMMLIIKYNGVDEIVFVEKQYDVPMLFKYKEYYGYNLNEFLTLSSKHFFQ